MSADEFRKELEELDNRQKNYEKDIQTHRSELAAQMQARNGGCYAAKEAIAIQRYDDLV